MFIDEIIEYFFYNNIVYLYVHLFFIQYTIHEWNLSQPINGYCIMKKLYFNDLWCK